MKKKNYKILALWMSLVFILPFLATAQDEAEMIDPSFTIMYKKESDGTRILSGTIKYRAGKTWTNLTDIPVDFYQLVNGEEVLLGDAISDVKGQFMLKIDGSYALQTNEEGMFEFLGRSRETEKLNSAEETIYIRDIFLEISLIEEDDLRTVIVTANIKTSDGELEPVSGEDVKLFIPRMFNYLNVGEGSLEEGQCSIEFPVNIVGNQIGELNIVASIVEHSDYGTVEVMQKSTWGLISPAHLIDHPERELWTPVAPLWMLITLIVMLLGVWGHYIYTVVMLFLIHREGKAIEAQNLK